MKKFCIVKKNEDGRNSLFSNCDYEAGREIYKLGSSNPLDSFSLKRDKYSIQWDVTESCYVLSSACLILSVVFTNMSLFMLGFLFLVVGWFRPKIHIDDALFRYCNHSFSPNVYIRGRSVIAIQKISAGDEITFNYYTTEDNIANPFIDSKTNQNVGNTRKR